MNALEVVNTYFDAFRKKDLQVLRNLYSEDVMLDEWGTIYSGKDEVLEQNEILFTEHEKVALYVLNQSSKETSEGAVVFNEIEVMLWTVQTDPVAKSIPVIDIVTVNTDGLIVSVRAFRGF